VKPGRDEDGVSIDGVKAIRATERALLCRLEDGREIWVPRSVITDDSEVLEQSDEGTLVVKSWFAEKEELDG
jgi:hypothetical protein